MSSKNSILLIGTVFQETFTLSFQDFRKIPIVPGDQDFLTA